MESFQSLFLKSLTDPFLEQNITKRLNDIQVKPPKRIIMPKKRKSRITTEKVNRLLLEIFHN